MQRKIRKVAVIGSGVMGSGIAAHLANAGVSTYLLDMVPPALSEEDKKKGWTESCRSFRNKFVQAAKERMAKVKPSPLYSKEDLNLISIGNIEDDLHLISEVDWVIEVIVENLEAKRALFEKVEAHWKPGTIVSSNTSGVSINEMVEGCSDEFRKHFLGTHFFNPPRYMKLLEIIPAKETDPDLLSFMEQFSEKVLGKGVVLAKDTPNFIGNRIGVYAMMATLQEMMKREMSIEEVDAITGSALGRPNSATFRTIDLVGLDVLAHVSMNVFNQAEEAAEKEVFEIPGFLKEIIRKGWLGNKAGQGFYRKVRGEKGMETMALDYRTLEYRPGRKPAFASLEAARGQKDLKEKLCTLIYADDKAGEFAWNVTKKVLLYSASKIPEIADDIVAVDRAMKWGFNWEMGPFELWDAIGVEKSVTRMKEEGEKIPPIVQNVLKRKTKCFYEKTKAQTLYFTVQGEQAPVSEPKEWINLARLKEQNKVVLQNDEASLIDIGDEVACLEFHSPNNAIGSQLVEMIYKALEEVGKNYRGLVIGNQGKNFCVGANLKMILSHAQAEDWESIEQIAKKLQDATMAMKYFEKPVVVAPFGMTLGGGTELCFPASRIQAAAEIYMGLVETGVGVIPGGGGTKEVLLRIVEGADVDGKVDLQPYVNRAFETIAMAKVSTSGKDAKNLGFLREDDGISVNRDHLLYDAKQTVLSLSARGYAPRNQKKVRVVGEPGLAVLKLAVYSMQCGGYFSEHDAKIAKKLAYVLSGGDVPANTIVSEQYLLDLEREAFLSLCGEPKSLARMQHMLLKGKPLRN
ncbi:3-hydroxyacyl-CoA dehydrogenase NAD-binding domain-containing protein [Ammoniphilus sp. 3BR4]|uniref:3-hydroxyacyl-CoA dehydrogenase/enoyl-CoA hydratase family protein n=1 Tax=Ammoniphilus sp. 3BR4 TaxID=3158265 RepID=UPI003464F977